MQDLLARCPIGWLQLPPFARLPQIPSSLSSSSSAAMFAPVPDELRPPRSSMWRNLHDLPKRQTPKLHRYMGLTHRPPHGGGGHSAWCAWLAKELDHPVNHACEFSARLMGGRMLEIQSFLMTRQNNFDVRSILTWRRHDKIRRCPLCEFNAVHSRT